MGKTKADSTQRKLKTSSEAQKIIDNMDKVWRDLIAYKKSKNSPLVVLRDGKIEYVDPFSLR